MSTPECVDTKHTAVGQPYQCTKACQNYHLTVTAPTTTNVRSAQLREGDFATYRTFYFNGGSVSWPFGQTKPKLIV
jgi:hypothetical protein